MGAKRKEFDIEKKRKKKKNYIRESTLVSLIDEDYNLWVYKMVEVIKETHQNIDDRNIKFFGGVSDLLQTLCKSMKEVRVAVSKKAL